MEVAQSMCETTCESEKKNCLYQYQFSLFYILKLQIHYKNIKKPFRFHILVFLLIQSSS